MILVQLVSDGFRWMEDSGGAWLCLRTTRRDAVKVCDEQKPGKRYDIKISQERKRRSLDANAYCWLLIGKLAAKLSTPKAPVTPEAVYRSYIKDVADNFQIIPVKAELVEHWDRIWCSGHIGRMTVDMGPCRAQNLRGYHNIMSYLGSSDYDAAQMHRLIQLIIDDCREQGIEYATPEELARMEEEWGRRYGT